MSAPTPSTEPVLTAASATALVTAVLALVTAFGLDVTPEQSAAIVGLSAIAVSLVTGFLARRRTVPMGPAQPPEH